MVLRELQQLPVDGILGVSDDGTTVYYGLDEQMGDVLEEGTVVTGHCYKCECENYTLTCSIDPNCTCPNFTVRCEGPCDAPEMVVEYSGDIKGVPAHCIPNDTCVPDCTTPYSCPTPWSEWSACVNCFTKRTRYCNEDACGDLCSSIETEQTDECCTATPTYEPTPPSTTPYCVYPEIWDCHNYTVKCTESCYWTQNIDDCHEGFDPDMPCNYSCACDEKNGYKRNSLGECVKQEECECYNGTIPLPVNYSEQRECEYCNCTMEHGYRCWPIPDCYTPTTMPTTVMPTTPCVSTGETYRKNCNETCYIDSFCNENCIYEPQPCVHTNETCNNETHELSWVNQTDPCCPECIPKDICRKHEVPDSSVPLNFTNSVNGYCVSDPTPLVFCKGPCGPSVSGGQHYEWKLPGSDLPLFDLDYYSTCRCCQAQLAAKEVEFRCIGLDGLPDSEDDHTVMIRVTEITGCQCNMCT